MVMRFEIAVHAQRRRMRSDLSQQPTLDKKPQIVVDRGERNGWNAALHRGVNVFRGMVSVRSDDGLIDHLTLMRDRQTALRGQLTELFMGEAHDYRIRMSIKRPGAVSTEIFPATSKRAVGRKTRLWLSYHDRHRDPLLDGLSATLPLPDYGRVARHPTGTGADDGPDRRNSRSRFLDNVWLGSCRGDADPKA